MLQQNQRRSGRWAKLAIGEADAAALDVTGGRSFQRGDVTVRGVAFSHVILRTLEDDRFHAHGCCSCRWHLLAYAVMLVAARRRSPASTVQKRRRVGFEVMSPLRMAAAAAARPSSVSSCTSETKLADAFSFCMDISLEAGAKRSGEGVAMLGYESFNGERGPSPDLFDEIVGPGEHPVRVVDGDLAQVLHQELAAGPAGIPVGFGIK